MKDFGDDPIDYTFDPRICSTQNFGHLASHLACLTSDTHTQTSEAAVSGRGRDGGGPYLCVTDMLRSDEDLTAAECGQFMYTDICRGVGVGGAENHRKSSYYEAPPSHLE